MKFNANHTQESVQQRRTAFCSVIICLNTESEKILPYSFFFFKLNLIRYGDVVETPLTQVPGWPERPLRQVNKSRDNR